MSGDPVLFEHTRDFTPASVSGTLGFGPLEAEYQSLFANVLEDGVITAEERTRLEQAADHLGLDRQRLLSLEQAMVAAYEAHHQVRIVEVDHEPTSLVIPGGAASSTEQSLMARIRQLEAQVQELEQELRRAESAINVEVDLSDIDAGVDVAGEDADACWRRARRDPTNPSPYQDLYRIYRARGDLDRQWCLAEVLQALGAESPEQTELWSRHRSEALIAPTVGVSAAAWQEALVHPEQEPLIGQIFAIIAPAVLLGRVAVLRRERALHQPRPEARQDPDTSTVTAVRALGWAAKILGILVPPVYLDKDREVGFAHVPGVPPLTLIGKQVLSGRGQQALAFQAARHLCWYRQEHYIRTLLHAVPDLEDLFLAALTIGNPALPIPEDMRRRVAPIARAIEPLLNPEQKDQLRALYLRFVEEGGRTNLMRFSAALEKTASRVGFVLCNDLATALSLLEADEGKLGELSKDLLVYCSSERYFALRAELGIAHGGSG